MLSLNEPHLYQNWQVSIYSNAFFSNQRLIKRIDHTTFIADDLWVIDYDRALMPNVRKLVQLNQVTLSGMRGMFPFKVRSLNKQSIRLHSTNALHNGISNGSSQSDKQKRSYWKETSKKGLSPQPSQAAPLNWVHFKNPNRSKRAHQWGSNWFINRN